MFGTSINQSNNIIVNGETVGTSIDIVHLGNHVNVCSIYDNIHVGISKFNSSFNYFLSSFGHCKSFVKNKLFKQYCMSFYGSQIWPLWSNQKFNSICCKWRTALRRIWYLPCNSHCNILCLSTANIPIEIQLKCRFVNFYKNLINNDNHLISYLSNKASFCSKSTMSKNLSQVMFDLNVNKFDILNLSMPHLKK